MKKKTNWAKTKRYLPLYLMLLPGAALSPYGRSGTRL